MIKVESLDNLLSSSRAGIDILVTVGEDVSLMCPEGRHKALNCQNPSNV